MDPHSPIAQRFPLISRFHPACLPLPQRVHALVELADAAVDKADQVLASAVYNQASLLASDLGLPDLARQICHEHAAAYLHATPLPGMTAIRALEPVVNLARLQIRAGKADDGRHRLLSLYEAVTNGTSAQFENIHVPADLTPSDTDRHEVRAWLWRVILADGTRTLTTAGRWTDALTHIEEHRGIGQRMLDGRQVAVLAALDHNPANAATLIAETTPGEPWEQAVTTCLNVMRHHALHQPVDGLLDALVNDYVQRQPDQGTLILHTRLGLTILDLLDHPHESAARRLADALHRRTSTATDGYAARECLANSRFVEGVTRHEEQAMHDLVRACALGNGALPSPQTARLTQALRLSDGVIRASLARSRL
ncbi:hypothetical protein ACFVFQ_37650 [Streptomyces sp. NPDC057743]|uniref:hypothetical protein n=1 Tax=Streptomyces sp. NPDC057743 TaxID=3346236 RepID=UPI0036AB5240